MKTRGGDESPTKNRSYEHGPPRLKAPPVLTPAHKTLTDRRIVEIRHRRTRWTNKQNHLKVAHRHKKAWIHPDQLFYNHHFVLFHHAQEITTWSRMVTLLLRHWSQTAKFRVFQVSVLLIRVVSDKSFISHQKKSRARIRLLPLPLPITDYRLTDTGTRERTEKRPLPYRPLLRQPEIC